MNDPRKKNDPLQLEKTKQSLIAQREALKKEFKEKYPEVYAYFVKRGVDLNNLQKYSKNIAAAIVIANQLMSTTPVPVPTPTPQPATETASTNQPSDLSKAQDAWSKYGNMIVSIARKYSLDPRVIFATIMTESEGDERAYRYEAHIDDASYGLGQILYQTAVGLGFQGKPEDLYNPVVNIDLVAKYYKKTLEENGNVSVEQLVRAYNTGSIYQKPYPGHLERFYNWYNIFPNLRTLALAR